MSGAGGQAGDGSGKPTISSPGLAPARRPMSAWRWLRRCPGHVLGDTHARTAVRGAAAPRLGLDPDSVMLRVGDSDSGRLGHSTAGARTGYVYLRPPGRSDGPEPRPRPVGNPSAETSERMRVTETELSRCTTDRGCWTRPRRRSLTYPSPMRLLGTRRTLPASRPPELLWPTGHSAVPPRACQYRRLTSAGDQRTCRSRDVSVTAA
jgi:hypothetical protein